MHRRRNLSLGFSLLALVTGMVLLAYASVPLYRIFCQATGFGGTTQRAENRARAVATDRTISVTFDAQVNGLQWRFSPEDRQIRLKIGEERLEVFDAINDGPKAITGTAVYNVTPDQAGQYFVKVQCFCFDRQTIRPGETAHFPVSFYVDPAILTNPDMQDVTNITLSYTFFPAANP